jgi:hypothetical protein
MNVAFKILYTTSKKTPWLESVSDLYRQSDCRLSAKLLPIADIGVLRSQCGVSPTASTSVL